MAVGIPGGGKQGDHESIQLVVFVLEGSETLLWLKDASCDPADTFVFLSSCLFETKLDKRSCYTKEAAVKTAKTFQVCPLTEAYHHMGALPPTQLVIRN